MLPLLATSIVAVLAAQDPVSPAARPDVPARPSPIAEPVERARRLVEIPHLGVFLEPPLGAITSTQTLDHATISAMKFPDGVGTVLMQKRPEEIVRGRPASLQRTMLQTLGTKPHHRPTPLSIAGRDATVDYGILPAPDAGAAAPVRGVCIIPARPDGYVVFELVTDELSFDDARLLFEGLLTSVTDRELDAQDHSVADALHAGVELLLEVDADAMHRVFAEYGERLERLFVPGGSLAEDNEAGYRRLKAWNGTRGELVGKQARSWTPSEREEGFCLRSEAKLLLENGATATSESLFFVSRDRRSEFWSVEIAIRSRPRARPDIWREHGQRNWDDMSVFIQPGAGSLTVLEPRIESSSGRPSLDRLSSAAGPHVAEPDIRVETYLSRGLWEMLPAILAEAAKPGAFAFAVYDSDKESVKVQGARFGKADDGWRLVINSTTGLKTYDLDDAGSARRIALPDGRVWEPIEADALRDLYRRKGLPTD